MGRKRKDSIHLYVSAEEKEYAKRKADSMGLTVSEYIRYNLHREMEHETHRKTDNGNGNNNIA